MKELPAIVRNLLIAAILSVAGAMVRFEVVASNVKNIEKDLENHYVKKEQFVEVKSDIKYMKEKQDRQDKKLDRILQAVRK